MTEEVYNTITEINSTERYSEENKAAWRYLFQLAKRDTYNKRSRSKYSRELTVPRDTDEIVVGIIVDQWMADYNDHYVNHSNPQDDRHAGDCSCVQAMEQQAKNDILELINSVFDNPNTNTTKSAVREHLYNQLVGSSRKLAEFIFLATDQWLIDNATTIVDKCIRYTSCDNTAFISNDHTNERVNLRYDEYESLDDADQQAISDEYSESFYQDPECDPDDARFIGTPPRSDEWDDKMRSNQIDRKRGSGGVLNGIYTNTLPEPSYYNKESRNRLQQSYLASDNKIDVELGSWMKRMNPIRRKRLVTNRLNEQ